MLRSFRSKPVGWRHESFRHYLASKGVSTVKRKVGKVRNVTILAEPVKAGRVYPVSPRDVEKRISQMPKDDTKNLKTVEFVNPREKVQKDAWGQLVRSRKAMLLFSQNHDAPGVIDGQPAAEVNRHVLDYVIPHEVGHVVALENHKITDKDLSMAEARADAHVLGMDVRDRDVKKLKGVRIG